MSIANALANATSGLRAFSRLAGTVSENVANATTPGYARRTTTLSEVTVAGLGAGVQANRTARAENPGLQAALREATAERAILSVQAEAAADIVASLGEPGAPGSLAEQYANFERALVDLATTPEARAAQNAAVAAAEAVTHAFNTIAEDTRAARNAADTQIAIEVDTVNTALGQLERLDHEIQVLTVGGQTTAALEDQRQRVIDTIAERIPVRALPVADGRVRLLTLEGQTLFDGQAYRLDFARTPVITDGMRYNEAGSPLSGITLDGRDITPSSGGTQALSSGMIAGLFEVRDETTVAFGGALDALAVDLVERFQNPQTDPTLAPGEAGLFTDLGAALDPTRIDGLAGRLRINQAVDVQAGGHAWRIRDGLNALAEGPLGNADGPRRLSDALAEGRTMPAPLDLAGPRTARDGVIEFSSNWHTHLFRTEQDATSRAAMEATLADGLLSETGVDVDQELQTLLTIEQAYAANARVVQTVGALLQRLMEI